MTVTMRNAILTGDQDSPLPAGEGSRTTRLFENLKALLQVLGVQSGASGHCREAGSVVLHVSRPVASSGTTINSDNGVI